MASSPATAAGPSSAVDLSAVDFDPRFEAFLAASADPGLPPDIAAQIGEGLRRQYAKPPVAQTEAVLRSPCTPERVRQLVYWQGLTLVHFSAQLERFVWDMGFA